MVGGWWHLLLVYQLLYLGPGHPVPRLLAEGHRALQPPGHRVHALTEIPLNLTFSIWSLMISSTGLLS